LEPRLNFAICWFISELSGAALNDVVLYYSTTRTRLAEPPDLLPRSFADGTPRTSSSERPFGEAHLMSHLFVCGIDPGGGSSSPTAIVSFDPLTLGIWSSDVIERGSLHTFTKETERHLAYSGPGDLVFIESFFINVAAEINRLQQVIGALKAGVPDHCELADVANTTMKKVVGGHGRAEKDVVATGLLALFAENPESVRTIQEWIDSKKWDLTDALAIAVSPAITCDSWRRKWRSDQSKAEGYQAP
jgi:Holliday junction resolvasome RuvABC endonuclease subunit